MSYLKQTNQPRYALTVIDIFSKFSGVQPMTNKDSHSVYDALHNSFKIMTCPMSIYSDDDGAFKSKMNELFDGEVINHIIILTHANGVERFIKRIKQGMNETIQFNTANWTAILKHVLNKYLITTHSSTSYTPKETHKDTNAADVNTNLQLKQVSNIRYPNISINNYVTHIYKR